jgi:hypothetical protein
MLIFEHIPKTGGTTFYASYLPQAFSPEEVFVVLDKDRETEHERFRKMADEERRRFHVVVGHQMEFAREVEPQASFVSIVREPVQRVVSAYLHMLYHVDGNPDQSATPNLEALPSLDEFAVNDQLCFRNLQSSVLLGTRDQSLPDREIERRLASRYTIVGITEEYDRLMFYLHRRLGVPLCLFNKQLVRRERSSLQIDSATTDLIRRNNVTDMRVYGIASRLFKTQFDESMTPSDLELFRIYAKCLDLFRTITNNGPYKNLPLTRRPITLSDIVEYCTLLGDISLGKANYAELVARSIMRMAIT